MCLPPCPCSARRSGADRETIVKEIGPYLQDIGCALYMIASAILLLAGAVLLVAANLGGG
jgi:hypothetical protein